MISKLLQILGSAGSYIRLRRQNPTHSACQMEFHFCGISRSLESFPKTIDRVACGKRVINVIHAYGSSGRGGKIRDAARRDLGRMLSHGEVDTVVHGVEYSSATIAGRDLLGRFKDFRGKERSDSLNTGLTLVEL